MTDILVYPESATTDKDILCIGCIFYMRNKKCAVFKEGIPEKILSGKHDHRKPYPGDHGILFEPIEKDK